LGDTDCREACTWSFCSGVAIELGLKTLVVFIRLVTGNVINGLESTLAVIVVAGTREGNSSGAVSGTVVTTALLLTVG